MGAWKYKCYFLKVFFILKYIKIIFIYFLKKQILTHQKYINLK